MCVLYNENQSAQWSHLVPRRMCYFILTSSMRQPPEEELPASGRWGGPGRAGFVPAGPHPRRCFYRLWARSHAHPPPRGVFSFLSFSTIRGWCDSCYRGRFCPAAVARSCPRPPCRPPWPPRPRRPSAWILQGLFPKAPVRLCMLGVVYTRAAVCVGAGAPQGSTRARSHGLAGCRCWTAAGARNVRATRDAGQQTVGGPTADLGGKRSGRCVDILLTCWWPRPG